MQGACGRTACGCGQAKVTAGRRWWREGERAAGSGASAWWRSTNLDGIRDVVFEWHQKYSTTVRGRDVVWSETRTSSWTHPIASSTTEPALSTVP